MRAVAAALGLAAATACAQNAPPAPPPSPTTAAPPTTPPVPSTVPAPAPTAASPPTVLPLPRAGRGAGRTGTVVPTTEPPEGNAGAMEQEATLACIRHWESRGNYRAVSRSGRYRGAYQFDRRTWRSNGGTGDPAAASPAEQDRVAGLLLDRRGLAPWPTPSRRCA